MPPTYQHRSNGQIGDIFVLYPKAAEGEGKMVSELMEKNKHAPRIRRGNEEGFVISPENRDTLIEGELVLFGAGKNNDIHLPAEFSESQCRLFFSRSGELMIEDRTSDRLTTLQVHDNTEKTSQVPSIYNMGDEQPRKRAIPRLANDKWTIEIIFTSIKTKDEKPRKGLTFCLEWCRDFANPEHYWPAGAAESLENTRQKTAERFSNCLHYYRDPSKELENEPYFTKTSHAVDLATGQLWVVRKYKDDTIKANELEIMSKLKAEFSSIVACLDFPNAGVRMEPDNGNLYDLVKGYCGKEPSNRPPGIWFGSAIRDILTALAILEDNGISHRNISMKAY